MTRISAFISVFIVVLSILAPVSAADAGQTPITYITSGATITSDTSVQNAGYFVNEKPQATR